MIVLRHDNGDELLFAWPVSLTEEQTRNRAREISESDAIREFGAEAVAEAHRTGWALKAAISDMPMPTSDPPRGW
jgi:hypothetical protein